MLDIIEIEGVMYQKRRVKAYGLPGYVEGFYPEQIAIEKKKDTGKKSERAKTVDYLDGMWSDLIKRIGGYKCAVCGRTTDLNSHHIVSRSCERLRWDKRNGIVLCGGHHTLDGDRLLKMSAHKYPAKFQAWYRENIGSDRWDTLHYLSNISGKNPDLKLIGIYLRKELSEHPGKI